MSSVRVRPIIPVIGGVIIIVALGARGAGHLAEQRSVRAHDRMVGIAATINDPAGLTTQSRSACPSQAFLIRCLQGVQDPDALTARYQDALSASSGRAADARCETLPFGARPRSCLVWIGDGGHAVSISIDSRRVTGPAGATLAGSTVRIDAC
jgi:hypothetical protein